MKRVTHRLPNSSCANKENFCILLQQKSLCKENTSRRLIIPLREPLLRSAVHFYPGRQTIASIISRPWPLSLLSEKEKTATVTLLGKQCLEEEPRRGKVKNGALLE